MLPVFTYKHAGPGKQAGENSQYRSVFAIDAITDFEHTTERGVQPAKKCLLYSYIDRWSLDKVTGTHVARFIAGPVRIWKSWLPMMACHAALTRFAQLE